MAQLESENEALRREVVNARHSLLVNRDHVVGTEAEIGRLNRDIIRMIIGFTIADTGINVVLVAVGVLPGRTAPILDTISPAEAALKIIDPVP